MGDADSGITAAVGEAQGGLSEAILRAKGDAHARACAITTGIPGEIPIVPVSIDSHNHSIATKKNVLFDSHTALLMVQRT
jgi:hypothetical protein